MHTDKKLELKDFFIMYNTNNMNNLTIGMLKQGKGFYTNNLDLKTVDKMLKFLKEYKRLCRKENRGLSG